MCTIFRGEANRVQHELFQVDASGDRNPCRVEAMYLSERIVGDLFKGNIGLLLFKFAICIHNDQMTL